MTVETHQVATKEDVVKLWRELFGNRKYSEVEIAMKEAENPLNYTPGTSEIPKILGGQNLAKICHSFTQNFGSKLTINEDAKNTLVTFKYKELNLTKH